MEQQRWAKISDVFDAIVDQPLEQREELLKQACGNDEELVAEVRRLFRFADNPGEQIEAVVQAAHPLEAAHPIDADQDFPELVGPYRLVREIGRGGMGSVWLAERVDGEFRQTVAIKVIKRGMDTREILRRFRQERQILSLLNHPNIARLLDGGAAPDGRPYLVMEYVDGQPILEHCRALPTPRVLDLFRTVCAAVQHAHSNLVIHRDLKPSNILINTQGEVKLLDFGIAKLLESDTDAHTNTGIRMFSPGYASPEQIEGNSSSTAADVYSLGAVLRAMSPPKPDADLAAIIARAMRPEPELRYATAEQLSAEVGRYLDGQPVVARKGNVSYLVGKFVRRNKLSMAFAAILFIVLAVSLISTLFQSRRIAKERDRAENVSSFLRGLFAGADPERNQGGRLTMVEFLDDGERRLRSIEEPETRAQLMETMAEAYFDLGLYEKSVALHEELVRQGESQNSGPTIRLARTMGYLAEAESARGRHAEGERWGARAVETAKRVSPEDPATTALVLQNRCLQLQQSTHFDQAAAACNEAVLTAQRSTLPPADRARILVSLGLALKEVNKSQEAERAFQDAMPFAKSASTEMNSASAQVLSGLASLYFRQGKLAEGETALREAIEFKRKLYPNGHVDLARALNNLANIVASRRHFAESIGIYQEAHELYRKALGPESSELASSLSNMAVSQAEMGEREKAAQALEQVIAMQGRTIGVGKLPYLSSQLKYAALLIEMGSVARARPLLEEVVAALGRLSPVPNIQAGYGRTMLAYCLVESGQAAAAEANARAATELLRPMVKPDHWMMVYASIVRSGSLVRLGRHSEARALLEPVILADAKAANPNWRTIQARRYWSELQRAAPVAAR